MKRLRVAVTGAGGRVGSALVAGLGGQGGIEVVAIVRNALTGRLLGKAADVRVGSVTDPASSRTVLADCDAVVNCALAKGWPLSARRQNEAILRNIASAPRVRTAIHFSTVAVYGSCVDPQRNSFEHPRPDSSYGLDKLTLERFACRLFSARGIRHHLVRLGHVYGPSQWVSRDLLERSGDPSFALPFGGRIASNAVSIAAVVAAVRGLLEEARPSGIANLVDSPQSTWRTLFDMHTALLDRAPVGSLPDDASRELRERYYAAAGRPLRTVARGALATLGSIDLIGLARLEAFRHLVHKPLLMVPLALEQAVNRAYVRRKVRSAVGQSGSAQALPPPLFCMPAVPGPCIPTVDSAIATAAMRNELRDWMAGLADYRWDLAELDRGTRSEGSRITAPPAETRDSDLVGPVGDLARAGMARAD
jgi:nucleoside-diphosphate-sugar epimerase